MLIYKTTNLINGKFYIGQDSKNNLNYFGSGILLKRAIKKYGKHNFKKEILEICLNPIQLNKREIYWINLLKSNKRGIGYNIASGGTGGDTISKLPIYKQKQIRKRMAISISRYMKKLCKDKTKHPSYGRKISKETREKIGNKNKTNSLKYIYFLTNPEKQIVVVKNLKEFCIDNNLNRNKINELCHGDGYTHRGWKASFEKLTCKNQ